MFVALTDIRDGRVALGCTYKGGAAGTWTSFASSLFPLFALLTVYMGLFKGLNIHAPWTFKAS